MNPPAANPEAVDQATTNPESVDQAGPPPLCRPFYDRMLAGVASGVSGYLHIDLTAVRIVLAVLAVVGGIGVPISLAGWLLIPDEGAEQSIAAGFIQSLQSRSH